MKTDKRHGRSQASDSTDRTRWQRLVVVVPAVLVTALWLAACGAQFVPRSAGKTHTHPRSSTTTTTTTTVPTSAPTSAPASTTPSTTAGSTTTTTAGPSLTHQNVSGVNLEVPINWTQLPYPDGSTGDHTDTIFLNRTDPHEQLLVIDSNCVGCIQDGSGSLVPQGATNPSPVDAHTTSFSWSQSAASISGVYPQAPNALSSGYHTDGVVNVGNANSSPTYAIVAVTLPATQHDVAEQILHSVSIPAPSAGNSAGSGQQSTTTTAPTSTAPPASNAYQELQGTWTAPGVTMTFVPSGQPGQLTISGVGGTATPGPTEARFSGVNAGGGWLVVDYNFAQNPNTVTIDDGSSTYQAQRAG